MYKKIEFWSNSLRRLVKVICGSPEIVLWYFRTFAAACYRWDGEGEFNKVLA